MNKRLKIGIAIGIVLCFAAIAWAGTPHLLKYGARFSEEAASHSTPPGGYGELYVKDNSGTMTLYFKDDQGNETSTIAGASSDTLDTAYTAGSTITADASGDVEVDLSVTARKVKIANTFAGTQAVGLEIDSEAAARAVTDGLKFNTSGAGATIVDAIDASDAGIDNALNVGANSIVGTNAAIDFSEFDVAAATGAITINDDGDLGAITIEGTVLDINSLDFVGAGAITTAASTALTLNVDGGTAAGEDLIVTAHNVQLTATGALTLSPDGAVTTAIDVSDTDFTNALSIGTNAITGSNFAVNSDGDVTCVDLTATGTVNVGTFQQDALIPASGGNTTITLDGSGSGGVTIGATSTGTITMGDDVTVSDTYNVTIGEGRLTVDDDQNESAVVITASTTSTGSALDITADTTSSKAVSVTAADVVDGDVLYLAATEATLTSGNYIHCYDGAHTDFEVGKYGATTIAGNASGTGALLITAGDVELTAGHLEITTGNIQTGTGDLKVVTDGDVNLAAGKVVATTTADEGSSLTRNHDGAGTAAVLTVTDTHTSSTNAALNVVQHGTGASEGITVAHDGSGYALGITAGAARTGDVINIAMADQLAEKALSVSGAWTGTAGEGLIEAHSTGAIVATAALCRLDADTAKAPDGDGYILNIDDDTTVADTPSVYAVLINAAANEALNVASGKAIFAEKATFTGGLDVDDDVDIDFSNANESVVISASADAYTAKNGVVIIEQTDTTLTNQQYLLKLQYTADDNVNGDFILCIDDSGVAADELFSVASDGSVTSAAGFSGTTVTCSSDVNANGNIVGDGATQIYGVKHGTVDAGANATHEVLIADAFKIHFNSQATEFDLPADPTGLEYTFVVANASNLHIDPNGTDTIVHDPGGGALAAGDRLLAATVGYTVTLIGLDADTWYVKSMYPAAASWTDGN